MSCSGSFDLPKLSRVRSECLRFEAGNLAERTRRITRLLSIEFTTPLRRRTWYPLETPHDHRGNEEYPE